MYLEMTTLRLGGTKRVMAENEGCRIFESRTGMIVRLPLIGKGDDGNRYRLPVSIGRGALRIVASEQGGATEYAGKASVITDSQGNKLVAFHLPENPKSLGKHADFYRTKDLYEIVAQWGQYGSSLTIFRLSIQEEENNVILLSKTKELELDWPQGFGKHELELKGRFKCFLPAAQAAADKSRCLRCDHGHFLKNKTTFRAHKKT